jgi:hypothetical protein
VCSSDLGHTIRNLVIRIESQDSRVTTAAGLFGYLDKGAVVENLRIEAADVQVADCRAGILVGENASRVINCQVSGRVRSLLASYVADEVGGLAGRNLGDIVNCQADTDWVLGYQGVGGLVGSNDVAGRIVGCRATGEQVRAFRSAGGLAGMNAGYIIGSWAAGGVFSEDSSLAHGGLAGVNAGAILNCHADSNVAAGAKCSQIGGLVGENQGTITNCYANGQISTRDHCSSIGGLVGWNCDVRAQWDPGTVVEYRGRIVNSYAATETLLGMNNREIGGLVGQNAGDVTKSFWDTEVSGLATSAGGQGLTTAALQQAGTFLEAGWDFVDERANGITEAWRMPESGGYPALTLGLDGDNPRRLAGEGTAAAPYQIATSDDLGILWRHDPSACYQLRANLDLAGVRWLGAPIASFSGMFDGGGFVISHLTLRERGTAGLFGFLSGNALVLDLGVADANIVGADGARDLGVLAGKSDYETQVVRCYATGRLTTGRRSMAVGGLIGWSNGSIADCYARTDVSCGAKSNRLGGLLGCSSLSIARCYAAGAVEIADPNLTCGGLVGMTVKVTQLASYFLAPADGGGPNNFLGVPLADAQMKQQASFANWDFKNTWMICEGKDYPRLQWEKIVCDQP